ncbi:MAG: hypothetical protein IT236_07920 [Bacteroidia bacterium]|nr:hypothetical protein [Bacteroidia bacterium]
MLCRHIIIVFLLSVFSLQASAQEKGTGPKTNTIKMELKSNRRIRMEKRELRRKERAERKAIKAYHKRLQTKTVRKRMKKSRKSATRYNNNSREFFLVRWFRKKK